MDWCSTNWSLCGDHLTKTVSLASFVRSHKPDLFAFRRSGPEVPHDLQVIIHKAIDREPSGRYESAGALAEDLQRFVDDKPILARPNSTLSNVWRWSRRNPLSASLIGLVATLLVVGFIGAIIFSVNLNREKTNALQRLFESRLAQAAAYRHSDNVGQRFETIAAVEAAAELLDRYSVDDESKFRLRSELIGALGLADVAIEDTWDGAFIDRYAIDYHAGVKLAIYVNRSRDLVVENVETRRVLHTLARSKFIRKMRLSPSGRWAVWIEDAEDVKEIVAVDVENGNCIFRESTSKRITGNDFCFDAGNRLAFVDSDHRLALLDIETGEVDRSFSLPTTTRRFAISRDARLVAFGTLEKGRPFYEPSISNRNASSLTNKSLILAEPSHGIGKAIKLRLALIWLLSCGTSRPPGDC